MVEPTGGGLRMLYVVFSETATEPLPVGPSRQVKVFNDPALPTSDQADVNFHVGQVTGKHRNRVCWSLQLIDLPRLEGQLPYVTHPSAMADV